MALMGRATHVLQWNAQREASPRGGANLKKRFVVRIGAVSYTHLDVYKRQGFLRIVNEQHAAVGIHRIAEHQSARALRIVFRDLHLVAVSYTHLDVYKRQD